MSSSDASSDEDLVNQLLDNDNDQLQDLAEESNLAGFDVTEISSWKGVCDALETVSSVSELKAWARTHLFCPYFLQLYFDSVLPAQLQGDTSRGESFSTIVLRIHAATNSGDTRYVNPFADRSKWDKADYLARCLTGLVAANTQNIEGLFYRKNVPLERKEKIMWAVIRLVRQDFALSRVEKDPVDAPTRTPSPGRSMSATASEAETPSKPPKQPPPRNWRDELIPATKRTLQPVSQTPDLNEPYWQFHFIELCLRQVETLLAQETDPAEAATDKLPAKDELPDEADEKALTPFKLLMATAQTYSIYQPTGQEIDTLTLAHYTAETIADAHAEAPDGRLTLTQPTAESIAIAKEHQSWLDNLDLQRENHDEACKALGIQNPDIPKLPAMRINTALRFWQPVAIYALAQFRENPLLSGCILADMVGLGKTWMVTAYIMHRATKLKGQPTLIVCPPHLVWQWAAEIQAVTNRLQVIVYFGDARDQPPVKVKVISKLSKDVSWMTGKKAHHAVVITSYQTLAQRHGPAEYKAWAEDQPNATLEQWPKYLGGLFDTMIADEAHCLRNPNTAQWTAAQWLRPKWNILVTATPIFNSYNDLAGLHPFFLPTDNDAMWDDVPPQLNPFDLPADHEHAKLILSREAIRRFILGGNHELVGPDNVVRGLRLRKVWQHMMIRRTLSSSIPFQGGRCIGDDIPPSQYRVIFVEFSHRERAQYNKWWKQLRRHLFVQNSDGQIIWNMSKFRELTLITTWLFFRYCHHLLVRSNARALDTQARRRTLVPQLLKKAMETENSVFARKAKEADQSDTAAPHEIPEEFTEEEVLIYMLRGSPKLRALLSMIQQEVFHHQEKSVVWCTTPAQQFFVAAALHYARIDCRVFHSDLNTKERVDLVRDFTTLPDECMVLVCSYYVNAAGSNLQALCRNVHLFDTPTSDPLKQQAIGRVSRVGQQRTVKIYDYLVDKSFNAGLFAKNLTKAVPDLVASLNWDTFSDTLDVAEGTDAPTFNLGVWVSNDDGTISKVRHAPVEEVPKDRRLSPEDVVKVLISTMKTGTRLRDMSDLDREYLAKAEEAEEQTAGAAPADSRARETDLQAFEAGLQNAEAALLNPENEPRKSKKRKAEETEG